MIKDDCRVGSGTVIAARVPRLPLAATTPADLQAQRLRYLQAAILGLPLAEGRIADPVLAAHVGRLCSGLLLLHDREDLPVRKPAPLHLSVFSRGELYLSVVTFKGSTSDAPTQSHRSLRPCGRSASCRRSAVQSARTRCGRCQPRGSGHAGSCRTSGSAARSRRVAIRRTSDRQS